MTINYKAKQKVTSVVGIAPLNGTPMVEVQVTEADRPWLAGHRIMPKIQYKREIAVGTLILE
jgi:hypothetical protein